MTGIPAPLMPFTAALVHAAKGDTLAMRFWGVAFNSQTLQLKT